MKKNLLELLRFTIPGWAKITEQSKDQLVVAGAPKRGSGTPTRSFNLEIRDRLSALSVKEKNPGTSIPKFCPERHLNLDGTFCIGLKAGSLVVDETTARDWWEKLEVYLLCQETATESGVWPPKIQLSHGDAANFEIEAEALAKKLGFEKEYVEAVRYDIGPIAEHVKKIERSNTLSQPKCGCPRKFRQGSLKLDRHCWQKGKECLPVLEFKRRQAEREFWKYIRHYVCCGTLKECPLKRK